MAAQDAKSEPRKPDTCPVCTGEVVHADCMGKPQSPRDPKILVVDDEQSVLDVMVECISQAGYRVLPARSGREALKILNAEHPELMITDLVMPEMNGLELIEAVRAISPKTEILILTGHSSEASAIDALRREVFDYLTKPFNVAELDRSVKRALERARLIEENRTLVRRLEERGQVLMEDLSASQRRTLAVFNSIADCLLIVNREFTIVSANEGAATLSGVPARQLIGRKCYQELCAREEICPDCPALATFATGRPHSASMQREDRVGNRGRRDLEVRSYPLLSETGAIHEAVEHVRDVTEHKRAEEERLVLKAQSEQDDAMRMIGRLAAGVAHDFNSQLTVIKGCIQFLLEAMPADEPGRADAERISATVDRGARLVRQLLAFSRKQKIQLRSLSLSELVDEMAPFLRPLLGERVLLRVRAAPGLWPVRGDPGQIEQVITNLVVNARDAMAVAGERPPAGTLTIEMANAELDEGSFRPSTERVAPGPYVMLALSDTGSGMTPHVRRQIFEPFFTTKELGKGTGLGLSTVFGIVKQHAGHIVCESEPGQGSTFRIYLPRGEDGKEAPSEESAAAAAPGLGRGETVTALVAEDDRDVREIITRGLERSGYRVHVAADVEEALAVAATVGGPIHLLVTDVVMPGGSGHDLAERLLTTSPALKVLFISGYFDDTLDGPEVSGAFFLQKPFSPDDLVRKAREVLA
ncbi:MAG: response regulator [Candidatus Rokubacteria bacterium]|nr:response regulator [Candidatus Rokubacteria bacterium]